MSEVKTDRFQKEPETKTLGKRTELKFNRTPDFIQVIEKPHLKDMKVELPYHEFQTLIQGKPWYNHIVVTYVISDHIVESKSFKEYLTSFRNDNTETVTELLTTIKKDLESELKPQMIKVSAVDPESERIIETVQWFNNLELEKNEKLIITPRGIDYAEILEPVEYRRETPNSSKLYIRQTNKTSDKMYRYLPFSSLCPVTSQPDHAEILIVIDGANHIPTSDSLSNYLGMFRNTQDFHEDIINKIGNDILQAINEKGVTVEVIGLFNSRGGTPIVPYFCNDINKREFAGWKGTRGMSLRPKLKTI